MKNLGRLKTKAMSLAEVAIELSARGIPTSSAYVAVVEKRTIAKIRKALEGDADIQNWLCGSWTEGEVK